MLKKLVKLAKLGNIEDKKIIEDMDVPKFSAQHKIR